VGSNATRAALAVAGGGPMIACMSADADDLRAAHNATGVMLEFSMETQLRWIRRFVPESQAIGVLYNPQENQERVAEARRIAQRLGMRLVAREVHKPQDLPGALESLAREADLLLAVTDQTVLSPQTTQAILLFSFRNRMPFSGLSASWVKAGALYALERDYEDLGAQCAEMAVEVLNGRAVASIPPVKPRKVEYAVNVRTAEQLKLPRAANDRFVDIEAMRMAIDDGLAAVEREARRAGVAVGVGRPFPVTLQRLAAWLPTLESRGIALAPVSAVVDRQESP